MERGSGHNDKLDLWKCVAIYSVIFIHILLPGQIGVAVNCLARFAVPLFFLSPPASSAGAVRPVCWPAGRSAPPACCSSPASPC